MARDTAWLNTPSNDLVLQLFFGLKVLCIVRNWVHIYFVQTLFQQQKHISRHAKSYSRWNWTNDFSYNLCLSKRIFQEFSAAGRARPLTSSLRRHWSCHNDASLLAGYRLGQAELHERVKQNYSSVPRYQSYGNSILFVLNFHSSTKPVRHLNMSGTTRTLSAGLL